MALILHFRETPDDLDDFLGDSGFEREAEEEAIDGQSTAHRTTYTNGKLTAVYSIDHNDTITGQQLVINGEGNRAEDLARATSAKFGTPIFTDPNQAVSKLDAYLSGRRTHQRVRDLRGLYKDLMPKTKTRRTVERTEHGARVVGERYAVEQNGPLARLRKREDPDLHGVVAYVADRLEAHKLVQHAAKLRAHYGIEK